MATDDELDDEILNDFLPPAGAKKAGGRTVRATRREREKEKPEKDKIPTPPVRVSWADVETDLTETYLMIAEVWAFKDPMCAQALAAQAPKMAKAWVEKGKTSPRVARFLTGISGATGWAGIVAAHGPFLLAVMMHHVAGPKLGEGFANAFGGDGGGVVFPFPGTDFGGGGIPQPPGSESEDSPMGS